VYGYAVKQSIIDADLVREVLVDRQAAGALQLFAGVENIAPVVELRAVG